ncbi:E3 ubiquitin-protein ligase E3D-like [Lytechinus variegatus]|uniref:E3 ubiquitin-protein ligase E3D-like n=1 Tax=Lytechinus variegatus TaxID=7654 RepID=UPI001BB0FEF9|nr:E3 ubiquitin-protein ligase E3D-like [Lytechinus variegatus]
MEDPVLYGEFRRQLKAVQISIGVNVKSIDNTSEKCRLNSSQTYSIEVRSDAIILVCDKPFKQWTFLLPEGLHSLPGSCSGLEWIQGEGIQMRLQLETSDEDDGGEKRGELDEETSDQFLKALVDPNCEVTCSRCGAILVQPVSGFKKVLPLPSGDWGDMAADMWCCKSKVIAEERGKTSPLQLTPEEGCIMVDDLYLLVNSRMLTKGSVQMEVKKKTVASNKQGRAGKWFSILCQRCGCILGSIDSSGGSSQLETTKLYRYAICIQGKGNGLSHTINPLQHTICSLMVKLFKTQMTFKYIIEDEEEHRPRLLIWLLGIDTRLLYGGAPSINREETGNSSSHQPSSSVPLEGSRLEIQLKSQPIVKVLYQTCTSDAGLRLGEEWNKDLMVHGITLTKEACLQLGLLLATSTLQAPPSMRQMNGFMVGSLKL